MTLEQRARELAGRMMGWRPELAPEPAVAKALEALREAWLEGREEAAKVADDAPTWSKFQWEARSWEIASRIRALPEPR